MDVLQKLDRMREPCLMEGSHSASKRDAENVFIIAVRKYYSSLLSPMPRLLDNLDARPWKKCGLCMQGKIGYDGEMKKLLLLLFFPLLIVACSAVSKGLTEEDVAQYIKAYKAIAAHSSELDKLQKQNNAISLMTCGPCLARLEEIVQGVGYKDVKTFLAMDLRMHVTMRAWLHVAIGKLAGQAGQSVAAADLCSVKEEIVRSQDPKEMALHCARLKTYSSYLDKLGALAVQVAERLLQVGDIDVMARHADAIANAWSNEKLPYDFRHGGDGFDD